VPTYEYRCVSCEHQFERFQRMSDDPVKECEVCGEPVKRLLFPVAIHFKGNGFYSTDYAKRNSIGTPGTNTANGGSSDSSSDSSADKPAASSQAASGDKSGDKAASKPSDGGKSTAGASTAKND
jgi:putative FmdB family regulatory protein